MGMENLTLKYYMPTRIVFGEGVAAQLGSLEEVRGKRVLLQHYRSFANQSMLRDLNTNASFFFNCDLYEEDPSVQLITDLAEILEREAIESIVAIGGGSAIDAAKGAIGLMYAKSGKLADLVAVPTTSGTGSEVTPYAMIRGADGSKYDASKGGGLGVFPKVALCDPELTVSMPRRVTGNTGLDAFSHALEGYFTVACTGMMEELAVGCFRRVRDHLPTALARPTDIQARSQVMMAAMEGGLVLTCCGTVLVHAMGYALSKELGLPHGLANAVFMAAFVQRFADRGSARARFILDLFDGGFKRFIDDSLDGSNLLRLSPSLKEECMKMGLAKLATLGSPLTGLPDSIIPLTEEDLRFIVESSSF